MTDFEKFIKERKDKSVKETFDPEKRISFYQQKVSDFFQMVEKEWLVDVITSGDVKIDKNPKYITEEKLGTYQASEMEITFGDVTVKLEPIGTILLGTNARIDMVYNAESIMCVRVGKNITRPSQLIHISVNGEKEFPNFEPGEATWKFVLNQNMGAEYIEITKETFQQTMMDLINGEI